MIKLSKRIKQDCRIVGKVPHFDSLPTHSPTHPHFSQTIIVSQNPFWKYVKITPFLAKNGHLSPAAPIATTSKIYIYSYYIFLICILSIAVKNFLARFWRADSCFFKQFIALSSCQTHCAVTVSSARCAGSRGIFAGSRTRNPAFFWAHQKS